LRFKGTRLKSRGVPLRFQGASQKKTNRPEQLIARSEGKFAPFLSSRREMSEIMCFLTNCGLLIRTEQPHGVYSSHSEARAHRRASQIYPIS
jgi:hypothetical protein